jgi:hypothetical protein
MASSEYYDGSVRHVNERIYGSRVILPQATKSKSRQDLMLGIIVL